MARQDQTPKSCAYGFRGLGARNPADLFYLDEISQLGKQLTDFRFVPCLSETWPEDWSEIGVAGESGLVTEVVDRQETGLAGCDHYLCGPPPMVDAAIALLESNDVPREQIHYDKFTTSVAP